MSVDITDAWTTVFDLIDDLATLLVKVLVEDVFFELFWNQIFVRFFITMTGTWGFLIVMIVFLWAFHNKYIRGR